MMDFQRADGTDIRIYPRDHTALDGAGSTDDASTMEALDYCCAILLVLSDECASKFTQEDGNDHYFFKIIERACEREKENKVRILPLFMSRQIVYEGQVGLVKFGTWAYKFKNESVRAYIEHIGSLQGLFVDPSDWVSKWEKVYSFWEETHDALVPITFWNFCQEIDFPKIRRMLGGGIIGCCCGVCCACVPGKTKCWHECRMGLLMGNMACYLVGAIIMYATGFYANCGSAGDETCNTVQTALFITGSVLAVIGVLMGLFVYLLAQKKVREKLPPQLTAIVASKEAGRVTNV